MELLYITWILCVVPRLVSLEPFQCLNLRHRLTRKDLSTHKGIYISDVFIFRSGVFVVVICTYVF